MGIFVDIGLVAIFLIAVIIGAVKGLCRQFSRPLLGLLSIAGAVVLVIVIYPLLANMGGMISFVSAVSGWFGNPMYTTVVSSAEQLSQTMSGSYLAILSGMSDTIFAKMQSSLAPGGLPLTIGNWFGRMIVNVIVEFFLWLAFYLAIKYLLKGIKYLLMKITSVVVFKSIDKVFGIIWAAALTYLIVIGVVLTAAEVVIVRFLPGMTEWLTNMLAGSTVLRFFHNTNVLGSLLAGMLGAPLPVLS